MDRDAFPRWHRIQKRPGGTPLTQFGDAAATETYRSEQVGSIMTALRNQVLEGKLHPGTQA